MCLQVKFSQERVGDIRLLGARIRRFFQERQQCLFFEKEKLFHRWGSRIDTFDQHIGVQEVMLDALHLLDAEQDDCRDRVSRMSGARGFMALPEEQLRVSDFRLFMRSIMYDVQVRKQVQWFWKRLQWTHMLHRRDLYEKLVKDLPVESPSYDPESDRMPLLLVSKSEFYASLDALKARYGISQVSSERDEGQELFHCINQLFVKHFLNQVWMNPLCFVC